MSMEWDIYVVWCVLYCFIYVKKKKQYILFDASMDGGRGGEMCVCVHPGRCDDLCWQTLVSWCECVGGAACNRIACPLCV